MPRTLPRVVLAAKSVAARRLQRAGIRLRDYSVTPKTKERYSKAVAQILPFLESQPDLSDMDWLVCEWIEAQWARGTAISDIADALSGLHFFWPEIRGSLRHSWRLFRNWRRIESPQRAPPMTPLLARAIVGRAIVLGHLEFAALILLGFHCLLRTGELVVIQYQDLEFSNQCGVLSLQSSKSGLRTGSQEAVAIRDRLTLQVLATLVAVRHPSRGHKLWPHSAQSFRDALREHLKFFKIEHLNLKPYSLRRGGATYLLQAGLPLEAILVKGRWRSVAVARLYLEDGLAQLPSLRIPSSDLQTIYFWAGKTPATVFRP